MKRFMLVKNHSKVTHKMVNTRLLPVHNNKNNLEEDFFVLIPRNAFSKVTKSRSKDTFAPSDISLIPVKPDIYKHLIRCSLCDFATRVRNNLVKHLKLHNKMDKLVNLGSEEIHPIATVAPVNPPPVEETESSAMSRMTSLLPEDIDEAEVPEEKCVQMWLAQGSEVLQLQSIAQHEEPEIAVQ